MRVLVLGAGFGGLELTTRLSDEFGEDIEVVLVDRNDAFDTDSLRSSSTVMAPRWLLG
jgi:NADH dehydrogenase FAD-containing subunit